MLSSQPYQQRHDQDKLPPATRAEASPPLDDPAPDLDFDRRLGVWQEPEEASEEP